MACDPWPLIWPCDGTPPTGSTENTQQLAVAMAQDILWSLTGRRLGVCSTIESFVIPGRRSDGHGIHRRWGCAGGVRTIWLQSLPVEQIVSVTVDDTELDADEYRLGRAGKLHRLNGLWPHSRHAGDARVEVEYLWGIRLVQETGEGHDDDPDPPWKHTLGLCVGELATEIIPGLCGSPCKLPSRLSALTRQGVSMQFAPASDFIEQGLTGLPLCDAFIREVNPSRLKMRSRVYSPDIAVRV